LNIKKTLFGGFFRFYNPKKALELFRQTVQQAIQRMAHGGAPNGGAVTLKLPHFRCANALDAPSKPDRPHRFLGAAAGWASDACHCDRNFGLRSVHRT
jgi:hypothetical protein